MPVEALAQQAANDRSQSRPQDTPQRREGDVGPALGGRGQVAHDAVGQRHGPAAAGALEAAEDQQRRVAVFLECQAEVGEEVDGEADRVGGTAAEGVAESGDEHGCEALDDLEVSSLLARPVSTSDGV